MKFVQHLDHLKIPITILIKGVPKDLRYYISKRLINLFNYIRGYGNDVKPRSNFLNHTYRRETIFRISPGVQDASSVFTSTQAIKTVQRR